MNRKKNLWLIGSVCIALIPVAAVHLLATTSPRDESAVYEAVLRGFLRPQKDVPNKVLFVSIVGRDPDPAWLEKFQASPVELLPASRSMLRKDVLPPPASMDMPLQDRVTGRPGYFCAMETVEWRWPDSAAVKVETYLGGGSYVFRWQDGRWQESGYETNWIS